MVYLIINAVVAISLILASFTVMDSWSKNDDTDPLMNCVLFLASLFVMMAFTIGFCLYAPQKLSLIVGKITFVLLGWYCIQVSFYTLQYSFGKKPSKKLKITQWTLNCIIAYILFFMKGGISYISISTTSRMALRPWINGLSYVSITNVNMFQITSSLVFSGVLGRALMLTWFDLFEYVCVYGVPFFVSVMILVKAEHLKNPLEKQRLRILVAGIISSFIIYAFIKLSAVYQPMFRALMMVSFVPEIFAFVSAQQKKDVWDGRMILQGTIRFLVKYFLPAVLIGLLFTITWPLVSKLPVVFVLLFIVEIVILLAAWHYAGKWITNKGLIRDSRYAAKFANDISSISFKDEPKKITEKLFHIFKENVDSSSMKIIVDSGDGDLRMAYSSDSEDQEDQIIKLDAEAFDHLLNQNKHVIFREFMASDYTVASIRNSILKIMDTTNSDALILLTEGRHITGIIALGRKISNNVYNEYDNKVFTSMYSELFVIAYYMKNMLNESVVGTVNREIEMSGQIITSIQENMDKIKNDKVDPAYLMVPAHNIGGEFVDIIRLTDTRYIYIIGSLSGKGIAASMNMVILKSIIRTYLAETSDFKTLVQKVNVFVRESLPKGTIFSGIFGLVDFSTDTMYYINCGAPALFLYTQAYNNIIEIQGDGHILGFVKDLTKYVRVKKVKLAPGDIVFTCTEGVLNTRSLRGEEFGKARIENEIMENKTYPSSKIAQFIHEEICEFASVELEDDITIFMMKYLNQSEGAAK